MPGDIYRYCRIALLGVMNMAGKPFPTGEVNILHMYPMTFDEFIEAMGRTKCSPVLQDPAYTIWSIPATQLYRTASPVLFLWEVYF